MPWGKVVQRFSDRVYNEQSRSVKDTVQLGVVLNPDFAGSYPSLSVGTEGYLDNGDIVNVFVTPGFPGLTVNSQLGLKIGNRSDNRTLITFDPGEGGTWFLNEAMRRIPSSLNVLKGGPGGIALRYGDIKATIKAGYGLSGGARLEAGKKALVEVDRLNALPPIYSTAGITDTAARVKEKAAEVGQAVSEKAKDLADKATEEVSYKVKLFVGLGLAAGAGYLWLTRKD